MKKNINKNIINKSLDHFEEIRQQSERNIAKSILSNDTSQLAKKHPLLHRHITTLANGQPPNNKKH